MSQMSFSIPNEAGASFRGDVNSSLQALATLSSGASAPATTYARQLWADTTNSLLKIRNAANSAWIAVRTLDETFLLSRSSNTILGVSDYAKSIAATSTFTQTLTAAATLADGWWIEYRNDGTGIITLDPNASETIDGATTLVLMPRESCVIVCNGSAFVTIGRNSGAIPQASKSAAYTTTAADANAQILHPAADNNARTFTIDSNANVPYPIGTTLTFSNEINTVTIAITSDTLTLAGAGTTGSRTLAAAGLATALKTGTTSWVISGSGLT